LRAQAARDYPNDLRCDDRLGRLKVKKLLICVVAMGLATPAHARHRYPPSDYHTPTDDELIQQARDAGTSECMTLKRNNLGDDIIKDFHYGYDYKTELAFKQGAYTAGCRINGRQETIPGFDPWAGFDMRPRAEVEHWDHAGREACDRDKAGNWQRSPSDFEVAKFPGPTDRAAFVDGYRAAGCILPK
jgi:hypothetical protein